MEDIFGDCLGVGRSRIEVVRRGQSGRSSDPHCFEQGVETQVFAMRWRNRSSLEIDDDFARNETVSSTQSEIGSPGDHDAMVKEFESHARFGDW